MEGEKKEKKMVSDDKKGFLTFFTKIFNEEIHFVYVLDTGENIIGRPDLRFYVGETNNPPRRWKTHENSGRFPYVVPIYVEVVDNREEGRSLEKYMIHLLQYNFEKFVSIVGVVDDLPELIEPKEIKPTSILTEFLNNPPTLIKDTKEKEEREAYSKELISRGVEDFISLPDYIKYKKGFKGIKNALQE